MTVPAIAVPTRTLQIGFLFLDLDTCTRCRATDATLLPSVIAARPGGGAGQPAPVLRSRRS